MHIGNYARHQCAISKQHVIIILALLETLIEIFFCLHRYHLNSRQFYNGKDRTLNGRDGFVTVKMLL